jgi:uncharacterized protein (TIGR02001 family)
MVRGYARAKGEGQGMKKAVILATALAAVSATSAMAADMAVKAPPLAAPASPWDLAFGAAIMNDYIFRGITQSDHKPSVAEYQELRYNFNPNLQAYLGLSGESIDFPNHAAAEVDFYGGVRPTVGPVAFDIGAWYYYYPGGQCFSAVSDPSCLPPLPNGNVIKGDLSFWEFYFKPTWNVNDSLAIGVNEFYDPDWLNSGAWGDYFSGIVKYTLPGIVHLPFGAGAYVSGEFGHYWFGTTDAFYGTIASPLGIALPDYNTWNLGVGFTYKVFTLDLRYYDTDLSKQNCQILTSDQTSNGLESTWCGPSFVAKLSFDLTLGSSLK